MIHELFMPALSSTMTEGKVVSWSKALGEKVEKGETVLVVESDKADMDVESFYEGYLAAIVVGEGESAPVGAAIAFVAETEAEIATAQAQAKASGQPPATATVAAPGGAAVATPVASSASPAAAVTTETPRNGRTVVSPRARKLAKEFKVDLALVKGSGPNGRIIAADVEKAAGQPVTDGISTTIPAPVAAGTPAPKAVFTPTVMSSTAPVPLSTFQQAVIRNMMASLEVPTFHVGYTITTDALDQLYKQLKSKGVTMTVLLAKAIAVTLQKHGIVNSSFTPQGVQYNSAINIAVAVAMDDGGLITPVLKHADQMDIYSLSRSWKDLVERARSKQLQPDEYNTGTFTLSNLGMFGVDRFDAILPPGQGSILAIGASRPQVVATADGLLGIRSQMQVNITCDHRMIYGAHAAAFLKDLATLIETNPQSLTM